MKATNSPAAPSGCAEAIAPDPVSVQRDAADRQDCVTVLMAVYNGGSSLAEQLESLAAQDMTDWQLLVSDDGSADNSTVVVSAFAAPRPEGQVLQLSGPGQGGTANFLFLLREAARRLPPGSWLAFSDQDDVWLPDRLSRGQVALRAAQPDSRPALFCSRTWITDAALRGRRLSPPRPRPLGFRNALVQNIASGNTILLNPAAADLARAAVDEIDDCVVHDWWLYLLVSGAGGQIVHDDAPTLLYRQHLGNLIGANDTFRARLTRVGMIASGRFRAWNDTNIAALRASAHRLTPEHRAVLETFATTRRRALPFRLAGLWRLQLYRQSWASTCALWVAMVLGRL